MVRPAIDLFTSGDCKSFRSANALPMRLGSLSLLLLVSVGCGGASNPPSGDDLSRSGDLAGAPGNDLSRALPDGGDMGGGDLGGGDMAGGDMTVAPPACMPGQGDHFTCGTNARVRCLDATLRSVDCPRGCVDGTASSSGEATCSCGADTGFSRLNCTADGDLHSCAGGITWVTRSCGGRGCTGSPNGVSDLCNPPATALQGAIDKLGGLCGQYSPGSTCGLAVRDFNTGDEAHYSGNKMYVSASSAKAIWVAAALYDTSVAAVMPHANAIFSCSDNTETGKVIDLLSSPNRVNTFYWNDVQIPDSSFCHWNYPTGTTRIATNCSMAMGGDNFFTADDALVFVTALWDRSLLADASAQAELAWMQLSPRNNTGFCTSPYGGWLGQQLPAQAQMTMHHKAGWLPPSSVPGYSNSNEIGIIEIPNGHVYGVAILMNGAPDQTAYDQKQLPTLEFASCVIYNAVLGAADPFTPCTHP
jgi:hypothetical protein